jgi:hypothetical protein
MLQVGVFLLHYATVSVAGPLLFGCSCSWLRLPLFETDTMELGLRNAVASKINKGFFELMLDPVLGFLMT